MDSDQAANATMITIDPRMGDLNRAIWRYMPLEQLLAIMSNSTLHFTPLCELSDVSERSLLVPAKETIAEQLASHVTGSKEGVGQSLWNTSTQNTCVSCWCMKEDLSAAMWSLYATDRGVVIRSTIQGLQECFQDLKDFQMGVRIGLVEYYSQSQVEVYAREQVYGNAFIKWKSYDYECEVRAMTFCSPLKGANLPINPSVLIHQLLVSPRAEDWVLPVIQDVVSRYEFTFPVNKSSFGPLC
jgi:hypothetical protein